MSHLPMNPLSPQQQQKMLSQLYLLMGKQVQRYHKYRRMGSSSSVSVELAQALMESIEYTLDQAGGVFAHPDLEEGLRLGQDVLADKLSKAKALLTLVEATAPGWQTECRWDALRYLGHFLDHYDHLHMAHQGPEDLFYPILIAAPEGIRGIDQCLFYLNILWIENQIMAGIPDEALGELWDRLPVGTLNQCEHLLINGMGKAIIGSGIEQLVFRADEHLRLISAMLRADQSTLKNAAERLCQWLGVQDDNVKQYVGAIISQTAMWTGERICEVNVENLFL